MTRDDTPPGPPEAGFPELARCLGESGYTPPSRVLPRLVRALGGLPEESAIALERALVRAGTPALEAVPREEDDAFGRREGPEEPERSEGGELQ